MRTVYISLSIDRLNLRLTLSNSVGLKLKIDFPGYDQPVMASVPYQNEPVKFYTWWRKNEDKVAMSKKELIELLIKVNEMNPNALVKKHREILAKLKS